MSYQNLDLPRLKTHPYLEADMVKAASGVDFDTPTLAYMSEGNRRVLRNSGYPALVNIEGAFPRDRRKLGTYVLDHNLVLIIPGLPEAVHQRAALHEASHALRAHLRDYRPHKNVATFPDLNFGEMAKEHFGWQIFEEGFARYWETTTIGDQVLGLSGRKLREHHNNSIDKQLRAVDSLDPKKIEILERAAIAAYPIGHDLIAKLMANLEPVIGKQRAIELIGTAEPANIDEVVAAVSGIKHPSFIDLPWHNSLRYSMHVLIQPLWERIF